MQPDDSATTQTTDAPNRWRLEVSVEGIDSAIAAAEGGAHGVELCADPGNGGITPPIGVVELTRETVTIPIHVMLRPRCGDFCYDRIEFRAMQRELDRLAAIGVDGVVFGILTASGRVDLDRTAELCAQARPLRVTFHRAFDLLEEQPNALEELRHLGVDRILTSGGKESARAGVDVLRDLAHRSGLNGPSIVPAAGIDHHNIRALAARSGCFEFHAGSACRGRAIQMDPANTVYPRYCTDAHRVTRLLRALTEDPS